MFASIHPIQLGHTNRVIPGVRPSFCACGRVCRSMAGHWDEVQILAPNPILVMLREAVEDWGDESEDGNGPYEARYQRWLQYVVNGDIEPEEGYPTDEEFEHAEKVLRRLIALDKQVAWV